MTRKTIFFFLLLLLGNFIQAQDPYSRPLSVVNGLPSDAVYSILEDDFGYIWVSCNKGLYRYDGVNYKFYKAKGQNSFAGTALMKDAFGRIWYQNFDGECFYVKNDKLISLLGYETGVFLEQFATTKHLFVYEKNAIVVFDLKTLKRLKRFDLGGISNFPKFTSWKNHFYYISNKVLFVIDDDLIPRKIADIPVDFIQRHKIVAYEKNVYIEVEAKEETQIWGVDLVTKKTTKVHSFSKKIILQNLCIKENKLWVQTTDGIYVSNIKKPGEFKHYFKSKNFSALLIDRKHNYWFTSPVSGIHIVPEFNTNLFNLDKRRGLRFIFQDADNLLISTQKEELLTLNIKTNTLTEKYKGQNNSEIYYLYEDKEDKHLVFVASDGNTYFAKNGDIKNKISVSQAFKKVVKLDKNTYAFVSSSAFGFFEIKSKTSNSSWIENVKPKETLKSDWLTIHFLDKESRFRALLLDSLSNTIYFSSNQDCYTFKAGKITQISTANSKMNFVNFFQVNKNIYGVSILGEIYEIKKNNTCENASHLFGLKGVEVEQVKVFGNDVIIKTARQVLVFDFLSSNKFEQTAAFDRTNLVCSDFTLHNNYVWLLTTNGLIRWEPKPYSMHLMKGKWDISSCQLNDRKFDWKKHIYFKDEESNLFLRYDILDFGVQSIVKMDYRINHSNWKEVSIDNRTLNFPALTSGEYAIELRATFLNGVHDSKLIRFSILKPFWATVWFYILVFSLILVLMIVFFRYQIRQIKLRNSLMNEKINLESNLTKSLLSSIKAQMNPHFIFNALNTIQAYIYMNDKKNATGYLSKFSKLTRHILEFSEKDKIQLSEEIYALELYLELEKMRFQDDFSYAISYDKNRISGVQIPSMLIQPYVENAIKHGLLHLQGAKTIRVQFTIENEVLVVEVEDNGIGRKRAAEINSKRAESHTSFSTKANELRIQLMGKDGSCGVEIEDKYTLTNQATGTIVRLHIKLK